MSAIPSLLSVEIEVHPGEQLALPPSIVGSIGPGVWRITVEPVESETAAPIRDHTAFLSGYADEDEGLYDDFAAR